MFSGILLIGIGLVTTISYQIGKMKGYDQCEEENNIYQKELDMVKGANEHAER
jgi:hypothetical protein